MDSGQRGLFFKARAAARYQEAAAMAPGSGTDVRISADTYDERPACIKENHHMAYKSTETVKKKKKKTSKCNSLTV